MKQKTCFFLVLVFSSFFFNQAGADGSNIPKLFITLNSTVYIPCHVDFGTDHENKTPLSWTRVGYDGSVQFMKADNFVPPTNVESHPMYLSSFDYLVVRNMTKLLSGTYTCHTDKGNASTLVHVLDGEITPIASSVESHKPTKPSCSDNFDLVHGKCLYYSNEKKTWKAAHRDCMFRTSSLITFKDVKDLASFLLNLQKSGPTHYEFFMWAGYALFDESNSQFGALQNDAQVSPLLHKFFAKLSTCGRLETIKFAGIVPLPHAQCNSFQYNYLCEQPTL